MKTAKFKPETIVGKLFDAMNTRIQTLKDNEQTVSVEFKSILAHFNPEGDSYRAMIHAVENTKTFFDFSTLLSVASKAKPNKGHDAQYVQAKALVKIINFAKAFAQKDFRILDNHTRSIMINTMVNNGVISSRTAFATLVRVEYDALESQDEKISARNNYTAGTGTTQLSSTRELFRIFGLTDGIKGARDAQIVFTDETKSALIEHFAPIAKKLGLSVEEETEENEETEPA
jgi:hypothetical protein